jgi:hypothetical protein
MYSISLKFLALKVKNLIISLFIGKNFAFQNRNARENTNKIKDYKVYLDQIKIAIRKIGAVYSGKKEIFDSKIRSSDTRRGCR